VSAISLFSGIINIYYYEDIITAIVVDHTKNYTLAKYLHIVTLAMFYTSFIATTKP